LARSSSATGWVDEREADTGAIAKEKIDPWRGQGAKIKTMNSQKTLAVTLAVGLGLLGWLTPLFADNGGNDQLITPEQWIKGDVIQVSVEDQSTVSVSIGKNAKAPAIRFSDISIQLFDDQGREMVLQKLRGDREWIEAVPNSLGSSWAAGFYRYAPVNGSVPAKVTVKYKGEEHTLLFKRWDDWQKQQRQKQAPR
jgi:hypothetical protein